MKVNIEKLRLYDFRNIGELELCFSPGVNILYGENAQGKTNILEAVFFLTSLKSPRALREEELIKFKRPSALLRGDFKTPIGEVDRQITLNRYKKKEVKEGENIITRWSELYHPLTAIYFSPEDLSIVKGEPSFRRNFLDQIILQTRPSQYKYLQNYYKVLSQRNALLKEIKKRTRNPSSLEPWDEQLAQFGSSLISMRWDVLDKISATCQEYYWNVSDKKSKVMLKYKSSVGNTGFESSAKFFLDRLKQCRDEDIVRSYTTIGPHRDDIELFIDEKPAKNFGSQGQQRLLALSLKFSQRRVLRDANGDDPILLLDDIMSELDLSKRGLVLHDLHQQVFITTADLESVPKDISRDSRCFLVEGGTVKR